MILKCLIIDDKPLAIDLLSDYVKKTPFLELVGTATNPVEGLSILRKNLVHIVLLDIQMPELNGLQLIKLAGKDYQYILTTAYSCYALDGFEHDVIDYLLKPIAFDRFYKAAEKALKLSTSQSVEKNPYWGHTSVDQESFHHLFIKSANGLEKIDLKELIYVESLQNYVQLYTKANKILTLQTLKAVEEKLSQPYFKRIHRRYIVSLLHVDKIENGMVQIGGVRIPIGDKYREGFYETIKLTPTVW